MTTIATVPTYAVRQKLPAETKAVTFDFTEELAPGTTLTGTPIVTVDAGLTAGAPGLDATSTFVTVLISGGVMGAFYLVTCRCGSTDGQLHEIDAIVEIAAVS